MIHLRGQANATWCGVWKSGEQEPTFDPRIATCEECLSMADDFGRLAANRFKKLVHARIKAEDQAAQGFDPAARAAEKQASRDRDAADLASGAKTQEQLRDDNGAFAFPRGRIHIKRSTRAK